MRHRVVWLAGDIPEESRCGPSSRCRRADRSALGGGERGQNRGALRSVGQRLGGGEVNKRRHNRRLLCLRLARKPQWRMRCNRSGSVLNQKTADELAGFERHAARFDEMLQVWVLHHLQGHWCAARCSLATSSCQRSQVRASTSCVQGERRNPLGRISTCYGSQQ